MIGESQALSFNKELFDNGSIDRDEINDVA